jgi:DnaJ family protein C protein 8
MTDFDIDSYLKKESTGFVQDKEVERLLGMKEKGLNPIEVLELDHVFATCKFNDKEIKSQFRKKSLLVHPDKCANPKAKDAFEILKQADLNLAKSGQKSALIEAIREARILVDQDLRQQNRHKFVDPDSTEYLIMVKLKMREIFKEVVVRAEIRHKNEVERQQQQEQEEKEKEKRRLDQEKEWESVTLINPLIIDSR